MASVDTTRNNRQSDKTVTATVGQTAAGKMVSGTRKPDMTGGMPAAEQGMRNVLEAGGMWTRDAKAPSYDELRPYGHRETSGFPVYKDLEARLLEATGHPDPEIAHLMATCAAYSYSDPATLSMIMARMGLEDNQCRMIRTSVDAMLIDSTAFLIQSKSGKVGILCYRGTAPMNLIDWMSGIDVEPERMGYQISDPCATVHAGVYRNVRATRFEVMNALRLACDRQSVRAMDMGGVSQHNGNPQAMGVTQSHGDLRMEGNLEALYITGHSLGGAMAALMGVMIRHERKYREAFADRLRAVYTFGQPMIGDRAFAEACESDEFLRQNVIRYVYDGDVVPHLPSTLSGAFRHFGREMHYRVPHLRNSMVNMMSYPRCSSQMRKGRWEARRHPAQQMMGLLEIPMSVMGFVARKFEATRSLPVVYSADDHLPQHYVSALTPPGVQNEFGD
ncbi:lipase family protein [Sphaerisporangium corydalis]|uniref:Lipase family protein n=1 Tax=Sphaerisporangium corydalis TaxID=1441875 RepID=A0ABV9EG21_9ACTN|nr:lipase family protein [Sphaerisporangium corydalis]